MSAQTGKRSDVGSWATTLSHGTVCQSPICCTVGPQRQWSRSYSSAQQHRNEVARSEDLFPTVRTLVRLTWTPPIVCNSHPEANRKGVWMGLWCIQPAHLQWVTAPASSLKGFNWLPAPLPPALQRVNHSLWTRGVYCLLVCWKLDFTPGGPLRGIQVSYQQWRRQWIGAQSVSLPLAGWQTRTFHYSQHVGSCDSLALLSSTQQIYH